MKNKITTCRKQQGSVAESSRLSPEKRRQGSSDSRTRMQSEIVLHLSQPTTPLARVWYLVSMHATGLGVCLGQQDTTQGFFGISHKLRTKILKWILSV